ncbi:MAG: hypothetical protein QXM52_00065 [Candidatus Bathyarchaeia archaeon]
MSQKTSKMVLPFSVLAENRSEPFMDEMERASIYCFTELERQKGGGLILKKPEEETVFLTKFFYPLWLVPWNRLNLIFDGLKTKDHPLNYKGIPEAKTFLENMQRSSRAMETYMAFLSDNLSYFQVPSDEKTMMIEALISNQTFLSEFDQYLSEVREAEASSPIVFLPSLIEETAILATIQELEKLKSDFKTDLGLLHESMKQLSRTTRNFVKAIRGEIRTIKEEFGEKIKKQEEVVAPKLKRINEEYDEQIVKLTKKFEEQLLPLQKEQVKLEKLKEQAIKKIERCNIEAKTCAANNDVVGERKWKEKANETKKELSEVEKQIKAVEERIKAVEESKSLETFKLRSEWEARIKEAKRDLLELESSRDAKIQIHEEEIERLEGLTASIIQQINNVVKLREADLINLDKLGIQQKYKTVNLVYIPFYMACYQFETKKRYIVFPPSVANSMGFIAKLKGALGKAKVKQLLVPRFKAVTSLLEGLLGLIERDAAFAREIYEAGEKANILKGASALEEIKKGLEKLKSEGWLSEKEYAAFGQKLV